MNSETRHDNLIKELELFIDREFLNAEESEREAEVIQIEDFLSMTADL